MVSIRHTLLLLLAVVFSGASVVLADWRTDAGYDVLSAELGAGLPTGAGIDVFHCEAPDGGLYLPLTMAATPQVQSGKTYHALAGIGDASGHAMEVGKVFYGTDGISNGVSTIYCDEALQFINEVTSGSSPPTFSGSVQNHSWIAFPENAAEGELIKDMLRRYDFMLDRDGILGVVALNNGIGAVPHLMAPSYNAVCAGLRNGSHSTSGTLPDQDGPGRMKPDLVVDQKYTSLAAPSIASAAAMLYDAIRPGFPDADHPQAVKAILLAGASKKNLPAWQRDVSTEPYDDVFGAGELNVLNAYHILAAGRQMHSSSVEAAPLGWDFAASSGTGARRYFFTVPSGHLANTFSAALTWHRNIEDITFTSSVPDLTLRLFASTAFTPAAEPIDQSNSGADNVEHLFLRNLPPGQYMLEVTSDTDGSRYALAWEAQFGSGPVTTPRRDAGGNVFIDFTGLDPFVTYTVETSETLGSMSWSSAGTFRTADMSASTSFTWPAGTPLANCFYRLRWNAVR
jgi:hypothetical protein